MNQLYAPYLSEDWVKDTAAKLQKKMAFAVRKADEVDYIPYSTENGQWKPVGITWWTNGFWAAELWQMYLQTEDKLFRDAAVRAETMMDEALRDFKTLHHDVGFMWLIQSGVRYAIEGNQDSFDRTMQCAYYLASRFNPNGFIRAWNGKEQTGWGIIDTMMNLTLLYWASRQTNDPRFKQIAMTHADTAMKYFVRDDGSCNHIVRFNPDNGEYIDNPAGQGCASGSSWSRGQSWALYGFTLSYMMTGKKEYLDTAIKVANYFIACCSVTDWVPDCDFRQPRDLDLKDNAAGGVAACGLMELAKLLPETQGATYRAAGCRLLKAMADTCSDWTEAQPAILTKCTGSFSAKDSHHITMNYADYFMIEAFNKVLGKDSIQFWAPDAHEFPVK